MGRTRDITLELAIVIVRIYSAFCRPPKFAVDEIGKIYSNCNNISGNTSKKWRPQ